MRLRGDARGVHRRSAAAAGPTRDASRGGDGAAGSWREPDVSPLATWLVSPGHWRSGTSGAVSRRNRSCSTLGSIHTRILDKSEYWTGRFRLHRKLTDRQGRGLSISLRCS